MGVNNKQTKTNRQTRNKAKNKQRTGTNFSIKFEINWQKTKLINKSSLQMKVLSIRVGRARKVQNWSWIAPLNGNGDLLQQIVQGKSIFECSIHYNECKNNLTVKNTKIWVDSNDCSGVFDGHWVSCPGCFVESQKRSVSSTVAFHNYGYQACKRSFHLPWQYAIYRKYFCS